MLKGNELNQGFSTIWYFRTPKSKFYLYAYPQIRLASPLCTPNTKFYPNRLHLTGVFLIFHTPMGSSRTLCGLLTYAYPRLRTAELNHNFKCRYLRISFVN